MCHSVLYLHCNSGVFCLTGKAEWAKGIHSEQFQPADQCRLAETHTNQQLRENGGDKCNLTEDTAFYQGGVGVIIDPVLSRSPDRQEYLWAGLTAHKCRSSESHTCQQMQQDGRYKRLTTADTVFHQEEVGVIIDPVMSWSLDCQKYLRVV